MVHRRRDEAQTLVPVLITGMCGSGKSTLVATLVNCGHPAVDLDEPVWSEYRLIARHEVPSGAQPGRDWVWREHRVTELLRP